MTVHCAWYIKSYLSVENYLEYLGWLCMSKCDTRKIIRTLIFTTPRSETKLSFEMMFLKLDYHMRQLHGAVKAPSTMWKPSCTAWNSSITNSYSAFPIYHGHFSRNNFVSSKWDRSFTFEVVVLRVLSCYIVPRYIDSLYGNVNLMWGSHAVTSTNGMKPRNQASNWNNAALSSGDTKLKEISKKYLNYHPLKCVWKLLTWKFHANFQGSISCLLCALWVWYCIINSEKNNETNSAKLIW